MPDRDPMEILSERMDAAMQGLLEFYQEKSRSQEKLLRRVMKALEGRTEPELQALAAEIKGVLGDE